jgi:hypothetical protein
MTHLESITLEDLKNMALHDFITTEHEEHTNTPRITILRVPKGWIYTTLTQVYESDPSFSSTFVPYSNTL